MGDNITRPNHYCKGREYEPKDVIRDWGLNFNLGSAVKYISRAGRKGDKLEDLQKAKQFLEFEIEAEEENRLLASLSGHSYDVTRREIREALAKKDDISMTCKEAEGTDTEIERKTFWYINGILGQWYLYQNIPDGYKARVINKIAQDVLDSQCDNVLNRLTDEPRAAVIDRIVEMVRNGELDLMDLSDDLYYECVRSRSAIVNSEYRKAMDGIRKYAEDAEDTVSINFEFEVDPEIDTDTVNVHVHIKNKED